MPGRVASVLVVVLLAGCGGGGPKTDADAVAQTVQDAARAVADQDGDKACGYLTADAQRQAQLQVGAGALGQIDCPTMVSRATEVMTPLDKHEIDSLQPANVQVNGTSASATLASPAGSASGPGFSVQLTLQKFGDGWKITAFNDVTGAPGGF